MATRLVGWSIARNANTDCMPCGAGGAWAKVLDGADGNLIALVAAEAGYPGSLHERANAEYLALLSGRLGNQGRELTAGDGHAAAGSSHHDFEAVEPST
jgi:hypothetical protein